MCAVEDESDEIEIVRTKRFNFKARWILKKQFYRWICSAMEFFVFYKRSVRRYECRIPS